MLVLHSYDTSNRRTAAISHISVKSSSSVIPSVESFTKHIIANTHEHNRSALIYTRDAYCYQGNMSLVVLLRNSPTEAHTYTVIILKLICNNFLFAVIGACFIALTQLKIILYSCKILTHI